MIWSPDDNHFLIVTPTTVGTPIGTVAYMQNTRSGTPLGLLVSLTKLTGISFTKVLTTSSGFIPIPS
jgi:hypothetical protein